MVSLYGDVVNVTEYENGYTISKNSIHRFLDGEHGVCYVPLPSDKWAIMTGGSSFITHEKRLDVPWQYYKIHMEKVVDSEEEAREICRSEAERLAKEVASQNDRIVYETA